MEDLLHLRPEKTLAELSLGEGDVHVTQTLEEIEEATIRARKTRIRAAFDDPATFNELVLRDEDTGEPVENAPIHEEWMDILDRHDRVLLWSHPEAGKTSAICIGRVLWELGKDPNLRVVVLSDTYGQAEKITKAIKELIGGDSDQAQLVRAVFPKLAPGPKWTDGHFTIRRTITTKSPSVQAVGVGGAITGSRIDLLIVDDILDHENTRTPSQRKELSRWFRRTVLNRMTRKGRVWMTSNAWHPNDLLHELEQNPRYQGFRFPVIDEQGNPTWPERWPLERIQAVRVEVGSLEFARAFLCKPSDESTERFDPAWLEACKAAGNGLRPVRRIAEIPDGCAIFTGVDLGTSERKKSDLTVLFTILLHPDGKRQVLWIESGQWKGPEIVRRIVDHWLRYQGIIVVEDVAAQRYILQFLEEEDHAIPVRPFKTTGQRKWSPAFGIESMAVEMERGEWVIPNSNGVVVPEVDHWLTDMQTYDPQGHTGDHLMASWFAREAARIYDRRRKRRQKREKRFVKDTSNPEPSNQGGQQGHLTRPRGGGARVIG